MSFAVIRAAALIGVSLLTGGAQAAVERIEVLAREPFAEGTEFGAAGFYDKITGRLHYAIDPRAPANAPVVDLALAPRDQRGLVTFAGDFVLLAPRDPAKGNGRLIYEVGNRGGLGMLAFFNDAPSTNMPSSREDAGTGFLFEQGYALLWSAWNWDVVADQGRLQIELPIAEENGKKLTGRVAAEITVNRREASQPVAWGGSRGYPTVALDDPDAVLSVRPSQTAPRQAIARERWRFARVENDRDQPDPTHVTVDGGFEPGLLYELIYTATDARVVGLGLAAIRDAQSFFRFAAADQAGNANPLAGAIRTAIAFGISQSGRVLQHMLWQGFHIDESARGVFDAALIHVAGAGKGSFNHRFAQTTRHPSPLEDHQYPADFFPFATVPQSDPLTGASGDVLARAKAAGIVPYLFYTGTSTEYWTRAASLLHVAVDGKADLDLDARARLYVIAGAQHVNLVLPERPIYQNCINPLDYRPVLRALLLRLDAWARDRLTPPDSVYPRIDQGTLGTLAEWRAAFPRIPGVNLPASNLAPPRLDFGERWASQGIADRVPPHFGAPYVTLVPLPDADGNDRGGIRLPAVAAALGTYTGWNLRHPAIGAGDQLGRWLGSFIPFAPNQAARADGGDPRPSIEARYASLEAYAEAARPAAIGLVERGLLRAEEFEPVVTQAEGFYRRMIDRDPAQATCDYLAAAR